MPSHHERNAKGVTAADVQGPGSSSSVGKLNVTYKAVDPDDTPASPTSITKEPQYADGSEQIQGPNSGTIGTNPGAKAGADNGSL